MTTPRAIKRLKVNDALIDEHIIGADSGATVLTEHPDSITYRMQCQHELEAVIHAPVKQILARYLPIVYEKISESEKIKKIVAMMEQDENQDETNLDYYAELFAEQCNYPFMPLALIKLFFKAGVTLQSPGLLDSLFLATINYYNSVYELSEHLKFYISAGVDVNYRGDVTKDPRQLTYLHLAMVKEVMDAAELIVSSHADIDYTLQDSEGRTVLVLAAKMRQVELLELMLKDGKALAALNISDNERRTALHYGYLLGEPAIVTMLEGTGKIDTNVTDQSGKLAHELLQADPQEITRVLNSVAIDERRHPLAQKNYFPLTPRVAISLPFYEQERRELIAAKFQKNGEPVPNAMLQSSNQTDMVQILNCGQNARYIGLFRKRLLDQALIPNKVSKLWKSERTYLLQIKDSQNTLLDVCVHGQQIITAMRQPGLTFFANIVAASATSASPVPAEAKESKPLYQEKKRKRQ